MQSGEVPLGEFTTVHCAKHGDKRKAYVCEHLLHGMEQGFFRADEEGNPYPDAWCAKCEQIRLIHGGASGEWNEASEALIKVRLVCGDCYEEIKQKNSLSPQSGTRVQ
jgi:hypothetical protein